MAYLTTIYGLAVSGIFIWFLIALIRRRRKICLFRKFGLICLAVYLLFDITLYIHRSILADSFSIPNIPYAIGFKTTLYLKIFLFAMVGMYYCTISKIPHLPLLRHLLRKNKSVPLKINTQRYLLSNIILVAAGVGFSYILYSTIYTQMSERTKDIAVFDYLTYGIVANQLSFYIILSVIFSAFAEEIIFRLAIQNFLAHLLKCTKKNYWIPVLFTAALWSMAHAQILDPAWVKLAQIFPLGITLGLLYKKYGAEYTILAHTLFNIIMVFVGSNLIH